MCLDSLFSLAGILRLNFVHQSRFRFPTATKAEHSRKMSNAYHVTIWISFELHFPGKEKKKKENDYETNEEQSGGGYTFLCSFSPRKDFFLFFFQDFWCLPQWNEGKENVTSENTHTL